MSELRNSDAPLVRLVANGVWICIRNDGVVGWSIGSSHTENDRLLVKFSPFWDGLRNEQICDKEHHHEHDDGRGSTGFGRARHGTHSRDSLLHILSFRFNAILKPF